MLNFWTKKSWIVLGLIIVAELLSFFGYSWPVLNSIFFIIIIVLVLAVSLRRFELGVYILLTDLFIGSKGGYLFSYQIGGSNYSIRMALFVIIIGVWFSRVLLEKEKRAELLVFFRSAYSRSYAALGVFVLIAIGIGMLFNKDFGRVFLDANGYFYLALAPIFFYAAKNKNFLADLLSIFSAAIMAMFIKTLAVLYVFSHNLYFATWEVYRWIADTGVGEIGYSGLGNFWRIFFQGHVFAVIGVCLYGVFLILGKKILDQKQRRAVWLLFFASNLMVIISYSRSFWVGLFLTAIIFGCILLFKEKIGGLKFIKIIFYGLIILIGELLFISIFINFPKIANGGISNLLFNRLEGSTTEAAGSSRMNLIKPLLTAISEHPIIGSGFGREVTYTSNDPRARSRSVAGEYTTNAFEWGYLDMALKLGLFGIIVYLAIIYKIIRRGLAIYRKEDMNEVWYHNFIEKLKMVTSKFIHHNLPEEMNTDARSLMSLGLILGLFSLIFLNIFTPYLNHPLGIGYLILVSALL